MKTVSDIMVANSVAFGLVKNYIKIETFVVEVNEVAFGKYAKER